MATKLVVEVCKIDELNPHPNADRLELAVIKGWQCVVPIGKFKVGDYVVYFPPDTLLPREWTDKFGVTNYCSFMKDEPDKGRIRCTRLRGEPSFGLAVVLSLGAACVTDVADYYGAEKYEPPLRPSAGDAARDHPMFTKYTDVENLRNFTDVLQEGEEVVVTEKIHGTNCRVGFVVEDESEHSPLLCGDVTPMAGSMEIRRKNPGEEAWDSNLYWYPWGLSFVPVLMRQLLEQGAKTAILFGETYGSPVQKKDGTIFSYDTAKGKLGFRAFDLMVDGKYLDYDEFHALLQTASHGCDSATVPLLYRGAFSLDVIKKLASGKTTMSDHIREGVVVKPVREKTHPKTGRVILKYIGDEYMLLSAKGKIPDFKDV